MADALFVRNVQGLTPRQFEILKAAANVDGSSQTAIMATTGIDRSSTGSLDSKLVRMGLLQRRRTRKDNRTYSIRLTPRRVSVLEQGLAPAHKVDQAMLVSLSASERASFLRTLERLVARPHDVARFRSSS